MGKYGRSMGRLWKKYGMSMGRVRKSMEKYVNYGRSMESRQARFPNVHCWCLGGSGTVEAARRKRDGGSGAEAARWMQHGRSGRVEAGILGIRTRRLPGPAAGMVARHRGGKEEGEPAAATPPRRGLVYDESRRRRVPSPLPTYY
eukprot:gene12086-biopygen9429